jgi:methylthioribose-1-phosphate isomerase
VSAASPPIGAFREEAGALCVLDQRALPDEERWLSFAPGPPALDGVCLCIETLAVRGAPAIGGIAAKGLAWLARGTTTTTAAAFVAEQRAASARLLATRPTAVNLQAALDAVGAALAAAPSQEVDGLVAVVADAAAAVCAEDAAACAVIGGHGAVLLNDGDVVMTICHTGAIATCGQGTALGVVHSARAQQKRVSVFALETRPLLQGARLTAWECLKSGIPVTLLTDSMAAFALARHRVALAVVGADRIAKNGDTANKIGTYQLALACHHHQVPFYVAAPRTTFDAGCETGAQIPIEERHPDEVRRPRGQRGFAPADVPVWNPAFDVTPASLITGFITDVGILSASALSAALQRQDGAGRGLEQRRG